jgi:tetratricopeptide (TPR) repeat protein
MQSLGTLEHLAFFEELARHDESDSAWREVTAGLVTLRLVDSWLERGADVSRQDGWSVNAVRDAIEEINIGRPVRGVLGNIVDVMESTPTADIHIIAPRLMAYASSLDFDARWHLAIDVYRTVVAHTEPFDDSESVIAAHLRIGFCLRQTGDVAESSDAYGTAGQLAQSVGDMIGVLRARIGEAKIAILKGNFPEAESILDSTIADAALHGLNAVESMALHDRASTAGLRGNHELAVKLAYEALEKTQSDRDRDRILHDIATAFYRLGVRTAARDAYLVLAATAQEQYLRWASSIQLLAISADDKMGPTFERCRRDLACQSLPPVLLTEFQFHTGRGYRLLGQFDVAESWLQSALRSAEANHLNQLYFETENELHVLRDVRRRHAPLVEAKTVSFELDEIADAVRDMRESMTAGV